MKILLDNCVAYRVKGLFHGHEVQHASDLGFEALRNGDLPARAARQFDALVTTDKKIRFEQNLSRLPLPVIELNTRKTRFDDLKQLEPYLESALKQTSDYRFVGISATGELELRGPRKR